MVSHYMFYFEGQCQSLRFMNQITFRRKRRPSLELSTPAAIQRRRRCSSLMPTSLLIQQRQLSIETRLLIPCIINTLLFVIGQLGINLVSGIVHGKWLTWLVMVIFAANSFVNPILYLSFSSVMRRYLLRSIETRRCLSTVNSAVIRSPVDDDEHRSSSASAIPPSSIHHQQRALLKNNRTNTLLILTFSSSNWLTIILLR